jgi:hypothetical protein
MSAGLSEWASFPTSLSYKTFYKISEDPVPEDTPAAGKVSRAYQASNAFQTTILKNKSNASYTVQKRVLRVGLH